MGLGSNMIWQHTKLVVYTKTEAGPSFVPVGWLILGATILLFYFIDFFFDDECDLDSLYNGRYALLFTEEWRKLNDSELKLIPVLDWITEQQKNEETQKKEEKRKGPDLTERFLEVLLLQITYNTYKDTIFRFLDFMNFPRLVLDLPCSETVPLFFVHKISLLEIDHSLSHRCCHCSWRHLVMPIYGTLDSGSDIDPFQ